MNETVKGRILLGASNQIWVEGPREELADLTKTLSRLTTLPASLNLATRDGGWTYTWSPLAAGWVWREPTNVDDQPSTRVYP